MHFTRVFLIDFWHSQPMYLKLGMRQHNKWLPGITTMKQYVPGSAFKTYDVTLEKKVNQWHIKHVYPYICILKRNMDPFILKLSCLFILFVFSSIIFKRNLSIILCIHLCWYVICVCILIVDITFQSSFKIWNIKKQWYLTSFC